MDEQDTVGEAATAEDIGSGDAERVAAEVRATATSDSECGFEAACAEEEDAVAEERSEVVRGGEVMAEEEGTVADIDVRRRRARCLAPCSCFCTSRVCTLQLHTTQCCMEASGAERAAAAEGAALASDCKSFEGGSAHTLA